MRKKNSIVEIHKYTVIEEVDEIYPETGLKLYRPKINILAAVLFVLGVIVGVGIISFGLLQIFPAFYWYSAITIPYKWHFPLMYLIGLVLSLIIFAKKIVIFVLRVYQRVAPYEIRCTCLFVPNCSEYMILAVKKYGVIRGVRKGFARLRRCKPPNGGEDYP